MDEEKIEKKTDYIYVETYLIKRMFELDVKNYGEILLLSKIITMSKNEDKACTAGNAYFSRILCTTERNVKNYLKDLKEKGIIKTFEKRQGIQTLTRYIYPQYKVIRGEETFTSSEDESEADEQIGKSRGTIMSNEVNYQVKGSEETVTHIIEHNRDIIEDNRIDVANAPVADAPSDTSYPLSEKKLQELYQMSMESNFGGFNSPKGMIERMQKTIEEEKEMFGFSYKKMYSAMTQYPYHCKNLIAVDMILHHCFAQANIDISN